jgi:LCP family protein required for cell wall assembly
VAAWLDGIHRRVPGPPSDPPEYKVYRSRRKPIGSLRPPGDLHGLRDRLGRRGPKQPGDAGGWTPGRVVKWVALAIAGWLLLSFVIFMISAQVEQGVSDKTKATLSSDGNFFGGATTLVLGSDQRGGDSIDKSQSGPARADSIMLLHTAFGSVHKLSIPRDAQAAIPGHGTTKINAAFALGGAPLMIQTVEGYFSGQVKINHIIEVDFEDFPKLIDALGGITIDVPGKVCSPPFDNFWKGLNFKRGSRHMDGKTALGYSRIRKNRCAPSETDLDRAKRQQQVFSAIRGKLVSPTTFVRLPWVSWKAPKSVRTDLKGPGLIALAGDMATGGSGDTNVLDPSCLGCGVDGSLVVSEGAKEDALRKLLGK